MTVVLAQIVIVWRFPVKPLAQSSSSRVRQESSGFLRERKPYYFIGTNYWYGSILGSEKRRAKSAPNGSDVNWIFESERRYQSAHTAEGVND